MVEDEGGKVAWILITKRNEIKLNIISFNPYSTTSQILLFPVCMWGALGLEKLSDKWEAAG